MTRADVINDVAKALGGKKEAGLAVDSLLSIIIQALKNGEDVSLTGFGTFKMVTRKARKGRNPATGEEVEIPATTVPKFSPAKALKQAIN